MQVIYAKRVEKDLSKLGPAVQDRIPVVQLKLMTITADCLEPMRRLY